MTKEPRHRNRFVIGRPRTSTLVLIGLFVGFLALYILVRPASSTSTNTGNVQQGNPAPTQTPSTPAYTQTPRHTPTPTPTSETPRVTQTPSHTPTPATPTGTGTATPTPTPTSSPAGVTSPASLPSGSPVQ